MTRPLAAALTLAPVLAMTAPAAVVVMTAPAAAQEDRLPEALGLDRLIPIMREEGIQHGEEIRDQMFPGRGGDGWDQIVAAIYDEGAMEARIEAGLAESLGAEHEAPVLDFFGSDLGERIVTLEISAREALLDPGIEDEAEARVARMTENGAPRLDLLEEFVETNALVETNVEGALNASYDFYAGLMDGGFGGGLTEAQVIADVYAQEPAIRDDTRNWVYSYLALAYAPLSDEELSRYIGFSETEAGQALNRALFTAFDGLYGDISRQLGEAAARFMAGEEI